jgi:hypothetical protein
LQVFLSWGVCCFPESIPYWLFFTAFVGANLFHSGFTGFCPLAIFMKALGVKPGRIFWFSSTQKLRDPFAP